MAKAKKVIEADLSTQEKIKEAARKMFTQKGYAATRTRDIAEEAGINLALLNYYFRSKEKLFQEVMQEKLMQLFSVIIPVVNDGATSLEAKIETIVVSYIDMLLNNPDLPIFVLNELRHAPGQFASKIDLKKLIQQSVLVKQLKEKRPDINPLHFLQNTLGMTIFPFISSPVFINAGVVDEKQFTALMEERKQLIQIWIKAMLKAK